MTELLVAALIASFCTASFAVQPTTSRFDNYVLDFTTPIDPPLQSAIEKLNSDLRAKLDMKPEQTMVGVLDLVHLRLAMINPDHIEYAASVAKIGILLAYFQLHPEAAAKLDPATQHELGLMAKASNNEMASKFSHELGLKNIQKVLDDDGFYDKSHGG